MDNWNPPEYWKKVTWIMLIRAGFDDRDTVAAALCPLNTLKTVREELEKCEGTWESVTCQRQLRKRLDEERSLDLVTGPQRKVGKNNGKGIRSLAREMSLGVDIIKLAMNGDIHYHLHKTRKGQLPTTAARNNRLKQARKLLNRLKHPSNRGLRFFCDKNNLCEDQSHRTVLEF